MLPEDADIVELLIVLLLLQLATAVLLLDWLTEETDLVELLDTLLDEVDDSDCDDHDDIEADEKLRVERELADIVEWLDELTLDRLCDDKLDVLLLLVETLCVEELDEAE